MSGKGLAYAAIYGATVTVVAYLLAQGNVVGFTAILFGLSLIATFIEWQPLSSQPPAQTRVRRISQWAEPMSEADTGAPQPEPPSRARLADDHILRNRSVLGIGLGSLLSDTGHEMATAALPGFLSTIGAQAAALGVIEGIADASLSASKVVGGVIADRPGVERKAVASGGYAITALGHGAFALAQSWPFVAVAHGISWIARGGKAPARDSLLSGSVPPEQFGRAFGVERSMDSLGAIVGPLLAAPLIVAVGYRWLFAISAIPGLLAALAVLVLVRETPATPARRTRTSTCRSVASPPNPAPTDDCSSASASTASGTSRRPC